VRILPNQPGHWAPDLWKERRFHLSVLYDGNLMAEPVNKGLNRNVTPEEVVFISKYQMVLIDTDSE